MATRGTYYFVNTKQMVYRHYDNYLEGAAEKLGRCDGDYEAWNFVNVTASSTAYNDDSIFYDETKIKDIHDRLKESYRSGCEFHYEIDGDKNEIIVYKIDYEGNTMLFENRCPINEFIQEHSQDYNYIIMKAFMDKLYYFKGNRSQEQMNKIKQEILNNENDIIPKIHEIFEKYISEYLEGDIK